MRESTIMITDKVFKAMYCGNCSSHFCVEHKLKNGGYLFCPSCGVGYRLITEPVWRKEE